MNKRDYYINKLIVFKDKNIIKVITGIRRCGKSTLLKLFIDYLKQTNNTDQNIIYINFESLSYINMDYITLYNEIKTKIDITNSNNFNKFYLFFDEIHMVKQWEKTINSLFIDFDVDIYITGSNAYMLSSELSTYLSGRYVEIKMYPLSFNEFYETYSEAAKQNPDKIYEDYLTYSSFPYATYFLKQGTKDVLKQIHTYIEGIFNTIILKDVMENSGISEESRLRRVIKFMASCIGSEISIKKISDTITSDGMKIQPATVENYIDGFKNAHVLYQADRYDVKGKKLLKTLNKFYLVDMGIRRHLLGNKDKDDGHILENIVYLELLRRGYTVYVGKVDIKDKDGKIKALEVDFVAENENGTEYYQIANTVMDSEVLQRELRPLEAIRDHYPKFILTRDYGMADYNGIKKLNALEWLLGQ